MKVKITKHGVAGIAIAEVGGAACDIVVAINEPHPEIGSEIECEADGNLLVMKSAPAKPKKDK